MKIICISEESHGNIGIVSNIFAAAHYLRVTGWFDASTEVWDNDKEEFVPYYKYYNKTSPEEISSHDLETSLVVWINEMLCGKETPISGLFYFREEEVFEKED